MRNVVLYFYLLIAATFVHANTIDQLQGKQSTWQGFQRVDFTHNQSKCIIVRPKKSALGNPWVWRARFFGHEPQLDIALLNQGYHLAYCDVANLFGSPKATARWDAFYQMATTKLNFSKKVVLEGMSRGGLIIFNWAAQNVDKVSCIYGDAPVCDIKSWPGGKGSGKGHGPSWQKCQKAYEFTAEKDALAFKENPIDRAKSLAKLPIIIVYGKADKVVPAAENCELLAKRIKSAGGTIKMIGKDKCGHHPHSLKNPQPIVNFILEQSTADKLVKQFPEPISSRSGLNNCFHQFKSGKARVAFLGGSITQAAGWRNRVAEDLKKRFPTTKFDFVFAGIGSTDSTLGAFRLDQDIFKNGQVDLLFIESAVNEVHNKRAITDIQRGVEGIIRHAIKHNAKIDIVAQYFSDNYHQKNLNNNKISWQIATLDGLSNYYDIPSINQAVNLYHELKAGRITPKEFARDGCHPGPKGHDLYAKMIAKLFDQCWKNPVAMKVKKLPTPIHRDNYEDGTYQDVKTATLGEGWNYVQNWKAKMGGTRAGFTNVPAIEAVNPGVEMTVKFNGKAIGIVVPAGPDVGIIEYKVDRGEFKKLDLFTRWSRGLNIPWIYMLETSLPAGDHVLTIRTTDKKNKSSKGHACRIVNFAVN